MKETIYSKFKDLPICFEYIYMQVIEMRDPELTIKHIDELSLLAQLLNQSIETTLVFAVIFHCNDKGIRLDLNLLNDLLNKFLLPAINATEIINQCIQINWLVVPESGAHFDFKINPTYYRAVKETNLKLFAAI